MLRRSFFVLSVTQRVFGLSVCGPGVVQDNVIHSERPSDRNEGSGNENLLDQVLTEGAGSRHGAVELSGTGDILSDMNSDLEGNSHTQDLSLPSAETFLQPFGFSVHRLKNAAKKVVGGDDSAAAEEKRVKREQEESKRQEEEMQKAQKIQEQQGKEEEQRKQEAEQRKKKNGKQILLTKEKQEKLNAEAAAEKAEKEKWSRLTPLEKTNAKIEQIKNKMSPQIKLKPEVLEMDAEMVMSAQSLHSGTPDSTTHPATAATNAASFLEFGPHKKSLALSLSKKKRRSENNTSNSSENNKIKSKFNWFHPNIGLIDRHVYRPRNRSVIGTPWQQTFNKEHTVGQLKEIIFAELKKKNLIPENGIVKTSDNSSISQSESENQSENHFGNQSEEMILTPLHLRLFIVSTQSYKIVYVFKNNQESLRKIIHSLGKITQYFLKVYLLTKQEILSEDNIIVTLKMYKPVEQKLVLLPDIVLHCNDAIISNGHCNSSIITDRGNSIITDHGSSIESVTGPKQLNRRLGFLFSLITKLYTSQMWVTKLRESEEDQIEISIIPTHLTPMLSRIDTYSWVGLKQLIKSLDSSANNIVSHSDINSANQKETVEKYLSKLEDELNLMFFNDTANSSLSLKKQDKMNNMKNGPYGPYKDGMQFIIRSKEAYENFKAKGRTSNTRTRVRGSGLNIDITGGMGGCLASINNSKKRVSEPQLKIEVQHRED